MTSEVSAVQCLPFSGFVNIVCRHLVVLRREICSLQGLYEHSARQTLKCRPHPLPKWDCHPRSLCSKGTSRQYTPYTEWPLWSAELTLNLLAPTTVGARINPEATNVIYIYIYIYIQIYGAPILDVSRSHTTTHHSR